MIRFNHDDDIALIAKATSYPFIKGFHQCIARISSSGVIMGGVFFTDYNVVSIQLHVAGFKRNWINRELLAKTFDYPFRRINVKKIIITVHEKNYKSLAFVQKIGFNVETCVRDVYPDGNMIILGMYRSECRFLSLEPFTPKGNKHGKVHAVA